jgi:hypothetical protein
MLDFVLYITWIGIPLFVSSLTVLSLIGRSLKPSGNTAKYQHLISSSIFLILCSVLTILIDIICFQSGLITYISEYLPIEMVRVAMYPLIFLLLSKLFPGTHELGIEFKNQVPRSK